MRRDWVRRRAGLLAGAAVAVIDRRRSRELRRGRKRRRRRVAAGTVLVLWPLAPSLSCSERGAAVSSCAGPECCCSCCCCCCCVSLSLSVITFRRNDEGAQEVERARAGEEGGGGGAGGREERDIQYLPFTAENTKGNKGNNNNGGAKSTATGVHLPSFLLFPIDCGKFPGSPLPLPGAYAEYNVLHCLYATPVHLKYICARILVAAI